MIRFARQVRGAGAGGKIFAGKACQNFPDP